MTDIDINSLAWLKTAEGEDWLQHAPLGDLVGRQAFLLFHNRPVTPDALEEYDIIEAAIRGDVPQPEA